MMVCIFSLSLSLTDVVIVCFIVATTELTKAKAEASKATSELSAAQAAASGDAALKDSCVALLICFCDFNNTRSFR
jgi:hypothetical protein